MSFYSSLVYYRPSPPPKITGDDLARFLSAIRKTRTLEGRGTSNLSVKFGASIDQDTRGTYWEEELPSGLWQSHKIEWDLELDVHAKPSVEQMIAALMGDKRTIYRAHVMLGTATEETYSLIARVNSFENEYDFYPCDLSIGIGPVLLTDLDSEERVCVGWMNFSLHGYGYLWPWTLSHAIQRAEMSDAIARLTRTCREFWPVKPAKPSQALIKFREKNPKLWPYPSNDLPADWFWGYIGT